MVGTYFPIPHSPLVSLPYDWLVVGTIRLGVLFRGIKWHLPFQRLRSFFCRCLGTDIFLRTLSTISATGFTCNGATSVFTVRYTLQICPHSYIILVRKLFADWFIVKTVPMVSMTLIGRSVVSLINVHQLIMKTAQESRYEYEVSILELPINIITHVTCISKMLY